jgi:hypothetical protein
MQLLIPASQQLAQLTTGVGAPTVSVNGKHHDVDEDDDDTKDGMPGLLSCNDDSSNNDSSNDDSDTDENSPSMTQCMTC